MKTKFHSLLWSFRCTR